MDRRWRASASRTCPRPKCITMDEHFDDAQVQHSQLYRIDEWPGFGRVRTVRYPATFGTWGHIAADGVAPALGDHTDVISSSGSGSG